MAREVMADVVAQRLQTAARKLKTADPLEFIKPLLDRSFPLPRGAPQYAVNSLTPGAVPCEPSFSEQEPRLLRFTIMPLVTESSPIGRRNEATREMRRLVGPIFGHDALRWFDQRSEEWRGMASPSHLDYGAWFGTAYDEDGLHSSKIYYELHETQLRALPALLKALVQMVRETMPKLVPIFTSIGCARNSGSQRVTFLHRGPLGLNQMHPLLERLGLAHQLPSLMQIAGLTLGGRFELPERTVLLGLRETAEGPEVKLEIMLGMLPDVPRSFLDLLTLGLAERPQQLRALGNWLHAFTPESHDWPGKFSVLSIRITPRTPARVSLYLRPVEFEVEQRLSDIARLRHHDAVGVA
jgi:hypothetical protein